MYSKPVVKEASWLGRAWLFAFQGEEDTPYNTLQTALQAPFSIFTLSKDISLRQEIFTAWKKYSMIDDTLSIL